MCWLIVLISFTRIFHINWTVKGILASSKSLNHLDILSLHRVYSIKFCESLLGSQTHNETFNTNQVFDCSKFVEVLIHTHVNKVIQRNSKKLNMYNH